MQQLDQSGGERLRRGSGEQWWQWYWQGEGADQRSREVVVIVGEEEGEQATVRVPDAERQRHPGRRLSVEEVQRPPQVRRSVSRSIS